jgi:hypothetical protein
MLLLCQVKFAFCELLECVVGDVGWGAIDG